MSHQALLKQQIKLKIELETSEYLVGIKLNHGHLQWAKRLKDQYIPVTVGKYFFAHSTDKIKKK